MRAISLLVLGALLPALPAVVIASPEGGGTVSLAGQQVVVVHRAGHQQMAIRGVVRVAGAKAMPTRLAWVIPLPSLPTSHAPADAAMFDQGRELFGHLFSLAQTQWAARTDFSFEFSDAPARDGAASFAVTLPNAITPGTFSVHPLHERGAKAIEELNRWLADSGLSAPDAGELKWFAEQNFTFLCVRCELTPGGPHDVLLPALNIGFDCESVYCPVKLAAMRGDFTLSLEVVSDLPLQQLSLLRTRMRTNDFVGNIADPFNLWTSQPLPKSLAELAAQDGASPGRWCVNRVATPGVNGPRPDGSPSKPDWSEDVLIALGGSDDEIPGFWYYGDAEISWPERMFREHALAMVVVFSSTLLVVLVVKGRQNRRRATESHHVVETPAGEA